MEAGERHTYVLKSTNWMSLFSLQITLFRMLFFMYQSIKNKQNALCFIYDELKWPFTMLVR